MALTKNSLLRRLQDALSAEEWDAIEHDEALPISRFNRDILLGSRHADPPGEDPLPKDAVSGLYAVLLDFLKEHMKDQPKAWKWVIISCLYLTFIAERPMHPIDIVGIRISSENGDTIYRCPLRSGKEDTPCHYCVCRPL